MLCRAVPWGGGYGISNWVLCRAVARTSGYVGPIGAEGAENFLALFLGGSWGLGVLAYGVAHSIPSCYPITNYTFVVAFVVRSMPHVLTKRETSSSFITEKWDADDLPNLSKKIRHP